MLCCHMHMFTLFMPGHMFDFFLCRACLRTWTLAVASSQSWITRCKSLAAGTPCWPNSSATPSASYQRCITIQRGWQTVGTTGSRRFASRSSCSVHGAALTLTLIVSKRPNFVALTLLNVLDLLLPLVSAPQAVCYLDEYNEMLDFIVRWSEKAKSLLRANIIWNSSVHLQEQIRMYQVSFRSGQTLCFHVLQLPCLANIEPAGL